MSESYFVWKLLCPEATLSEATLSKATLSEATLSKIPIGVFIKLSVQAFQPLIVIYIMGNLAFLVLGVVCP